MKVALISFHNAYNYGAALQAYGLQEVVELLGTDCEYINYINDHRKHAYDMKSQFMVAVKNKNIVRAIKVLLGTPFIWLRGRKFEIFYQNKIKKTEKIYYHSDEAMELNDLYDKFIVGSDQVWNYENNGSDWSYFLSFVKDDRKKISYSSSFGMSSIPEEYEDIYKHYISKFDRLAVREEMGVDIVREITGKNAHLVLDPVFLVGRSRWEELKNEEKPIEEDYIFFYTNGKSQVDDFLNTGYPIENLKMHILSSHVTPLDFLNPKVKVCVSMSPQAFINEIASAKLVVTASFHCLAFAIIFHKPVCVILTGDRGRDERLINLLKITGLENRVLKWNTTITEINEEIDYENVERLLEPLLTKSKDYLRNAIFSFPDIEGCFESEPKIFCQDSRCMGCNACAEICPKNAISMCANSEGFLEPILDKNLCVGCGACYKVCQVFSKNVKSHNQSYWAVKCDDNVRKTSSSGGMFRALSDWMLENDGIVVAAEMNNEFKVKHSFAHNKTERKRMCGTFYVQSDVRGIFSKTEKYLQDKRKVLFVGTPCQVKGLLLFLNKDYPNLYTCDILCHGVPSPMVFQKFIDFLKTKGNISSYRFRDKSIGWKGYSVSAVIDDKKVTGKLWLQSFNKLFMHNKINRESCASCPYTTYDRCGDISIGDFWGIEKKLPDFEDDLGVSLVICNTDKGTTLFSMLQNIRRIEVSKEQTLQNSLKKATKSSADRMRVYKMLENRGYEYVAKKYGEWNMKGYVKDIVRKLIN